MFTLQLTSVVRCGVASLLLLTSLLAPSTARGDGRTDKAIVRAHRFLTKESRMKDILGFVHLGMNLDRVEHLRTASIERNNRVVSGHFGLVYRYEWNGNGWTDLAFLCDEDGDVYEVQALKSNGVVQEPFLVANASITLLGEVLLEAFKDDMSKEDRALIRKLIENADAKGMLEVSLRLQQAFGG